MTSYLMHNRTRYLTIATAIAIAVGALLTLMLIYAPVSRVSALGFTITQTIDGTQGGGRSRGRE